MLCTEVEWECGVKISWNCFRLPTSTLTPQNEASNLGGLTCHWYPSQTVSHRATVCIVMYSKVVHGLFRLVQVLAAYLHSNYTQIGGKNVHRTVADGAKLCIVIYVKPLKAGFGFLIRLAPITNCILFVSKIAPIIMGSVWNKIRRVYILSTLHFAPGF